MQDSIRIEDEEFTVWTAGMARTVWIETGLYFPETCVFLSDAVYEVREGVRVRTDLEPAEATQIADEIDGDEE